MSTVTAVIQLVTEDEHFIRKYPKAKIKSSLIPHYDNNYSISIPKPVNQYIHTNKDKHYTYVSKCNNNSANQQIMQIMIMVS